MLNEALYRLLVRDRARKRRISTDEIFCDEATGKSNEEPLFVGTSDLSGIPAYDKPKPLAQFGSSDPSISSQEENYQP